MCELRFAGRPVNPWRDRSPYRPEESDQEERRVSAVLLASGLGVADGSRRDSGRKTLPDRALEDRSPRVREEDLAAGVELGAERCRERLSGERLSEERLFGECAEVPVLTCVRGTSERKPFARLASIPEERVRDGLRKLPPDPVADGREEGVVPREDAVGIRRSVLVGARWLPGEREEGSNPRGERAEDLGADLWGRETRGALLRLEEEALRTFGAAVEGAREREGTVTRVGVDLDGAEGREKRGVLRASRGELLLGP